jgi:predicted ATP-dependent endonuclease of OLD family
MLEQVRIQNFKSLKDVTLDLQKVNLLIGPNNSGKSNFLKALEFLSKSLFPPYEHRTYEYLTFKHDKDLKIQIQNRSKTKDKDFHDREIYKNLRLEINISNKKVLTYFDNFDENPFVEDVGTTFFLDDKATEEIYNQSMYIPFSKRDLFKYILDENNYLIYNPNPIELSKPFPILPNQERISEDASNLIAFFDNIRDKYRDNFESIEADLKLCVPEFTRIVFDNIIPTDDLIKKNLSNVLVYDLFFLQNRQLFL